MIRGRRQQRRAGGDRQGRPVRDAGADIELNAQGRRARGCIPSNRVHPTFLLLQAPGWFCLHPPPRPGPGSGDLDELRARPVPAACGVQHRPRWPAKLGPQRVRPPSRRVPRITRYSSTAQTAFNGDTCARNAMMTSILGYAATATNDLCRCSRRPRRGEFGKPAVAEQLLRRPQIALPTSDETVA